MKAALLQKIETFEIKEIAEPQLDSNSVILKVHACSICNSDIRIYHHGHERIQLPQILGHEITGTVAAVGKQVTAVALSDRVQVTPKIPCGKCYLCKRGKHLQCQQGHSFGYQMPGGYAEYVLIPSKGIEFGVLNKFPDTLSFTDATMAEPLACCIRAQQISRVDKGDVVVVIGGGPLGILHCRLAKWYGAERVILVDMDRNRLEKINLSSIDNLLNTSEIDLIMDITNNQGADVVIVACSSAQAQQQAFSFVGREGRINFFGGLSPGHSMISFDSNMVHYREISIQGSHGSTPQNNRAALDLIVDNKVQVDDLITHTFPLDAIENAFLFAETKKGMHISILP